MSILDDNIIEQTDIHYKGKLKKFNEFSINIIKDEYYNTKHENGEFYEWRSPFVQYILSSQLNAIKDFIKNKKLFSNKPEIFKYDLMGIKVLYYCNKENDCVQITNNIYKYNHINIIANLKNHNNENNKEFEIDIFEFKFWYPFVNIEQIRPYAHALYESIFNNPERLNILYEIKQVVFDKMNIQNLNDFYYSYII